MEIKYDNSENLTLKNKLNFKRVINFKYDYIR